MDPHKYTWMSAVMQSRKLQPLIRNDLKPCLCCSATSAGTLWSSLVGTNRAEYNACASEAFDLHSKHPFASWVAIRDAFAPFCASHCSCTQIDEQRFYDREQDPDLSGRPRSFVVGNFRLLVEAGRTPNTVTRNNPTGSAVGGTACLKGEAAGWTLWNWRLTKCCPDTTFKALTGQEAYAIYGVAPFTSDVITNAVTIGVCLAGKTANHG